MTVKLFGAGITDEETANILGGFVSVNHLLAVMLSGWILFELWSHTELKRRCGTTFFLVLGGALGVIFMGVDTQIALFVAPGTESSWPAIFTWLGFSFVAFLDSLIIRFVHATGKLNDPRTVQGQERDFTKTVNITFFLFYITCGFVVFLLINMLAGDTRTLKIVGMVLYLFGAVLLGVLLLWVASQGLHRIPSSFALISAFVTLALALFASFYFIDALWARGVELGIETTILVLLWTYAYMLLRQFKRSFPGPCPLPNNVPLLHEYVPQNAPQTLNV
jgi:hypothetical protein